MSLKPTVLDPQGQTICSALQGHGHPAIAAVRQGKFFDIEVSADAEAAESEVRQIAREVLTNPVIEDFRVEAVK